MTREIKIQSLTTTVYVYYLQERKILLNDKKDIKKKIRQFTQNENLCFKEKFRNMFNRCSMFISRKRLDLQFIRN